MTLHRKILLALAVTTVALTVCTARSNWDDDAAKRKADYVFFRACGMNALDSIDTGSRLLARAALLNPNDVSIAGEQALLALTDDSPDSVTLATAYAQLQDLFESDYSDYHTGYMVGQLAGYLRDFDNEVRVWQILDSVFPSKTDPAVNLANAHVKRFFTQNNEADFDKAISIFNRLERGTGKDIGLTSQKVRAYALRNDTAAVINEVSELLKDKPNDANAFLYAGSIYENYGRDSDAIYNYKHSCELDSTDGRAYVTLANFYRQRGDSVAYDREVFQALQSSNLEFEAKYEIMRGYVSELYSDSSQWARIDHLFGVLQEENPGEPGVHVLNGAFEQVRDNSWAAYEQYSYAMALDPSESNYRVNALHAALMCDSLETVISIAKEGMALFPSNFYYPIVASSAYSRQKKYGEAISLLKSVDYSSVQNSKAVSNLLCSLGDSYYQADSLDQAFDMYEKAISYDRENYMAYNNAGYFLAESGRDVEKAIRYTHYAVMSEPQNSTYLDSYAWAYFKNKDYANARKQIDLALKYYNYFADSTAEPVDTVYAAEDEAVDANDDVDTDDDDQYVEYVTVESISADVLTHAGDIYFMSGDPEQAVKFWQEALALKPEDELLARKVKYKTYFYK
jgi:tetratricopeptide (TPR) repeat protein